MLGDLHSHLAHVLVLAHYYLLTLPPHVAEMVQEHVPQLDCLARSSAVLPTKVVSHLALVLHH